MQINQFEVSIKCITFLQIFHIFFRMNFVELSSIVGALYINTSKDIKCIVMSRHFNVHKYPIKSEFNDENCEKSHGVVFYDMWHSFSISDHFLIILMNKFNSIFQGARFDMIARKIMKCRKSFMWQRYWHTKYIFRFENTSVKANSTQN
jgi:hypothetical protein